MCNITADPTIVVATAVVPPCQPGLAEEALLEHHHLNDL